MTVWEAVTDLLLLGKGGKTKDQEVPHSPEDDDEILPGHVGEPVENCPF